MLQATSTAFFSPRQGASFVHGRCRQTADTGGAVKTESQTVCTCFEMCSVGGFEVVLMARGNVVQGSIGVVIDCVIEFSAHSSQKYH